MARFVIHQTSNLQNISGQLNGSGLRVGMAHMYTLLFTMTVTMIFPLKLFVNSFNA